MHVTKETIARSARLSAAYATVEAVRLRALKDHGVLDPTPVRDTEDRLVMFANETIGQTVGAIVNTLMQRGMSYAAALAQAQRFQPGSSSRRRRWAGGAR
jgi:hypothetical protein